MPQFSFEMHRILNYSSPEDELFEFFQLRFFKVKEKEILFYKHILYIIIISSQYAYY